jgi:hypothetical protein
MGEQHNSIQCAECGSGLAHDQRYCLQCGARRGHLPRHVSGVIGGIMEQGRRVPVASEVAGEPSEAEPGWGDAWLRAPRAAAVAVMGMLGFGVIVGALVGASAANPLSQLIVAVSPSGPHGAASPLAAAAGGGGGNGGGGGGGGGTVTITTTTPAAATPTVASSGGGTSGTNSSATQTPTNLPPIKHVFMVVLSDQGYNETFGHTGNDPYLAKTLANQGELVVNYYAVAGSPLANEIALVSGQGPNPETATDCPTYDPFVASGLGSQGQLLGTGCVFPPSAPSLAEELTSAKLTWKTYLETKGSQKQARPEACRPNLGAPTGRYPTAAQPYAIWRNPFLFFSSVTSTRCPKNNASLSQLAVDLKKASTTPSFSYIVADTCDDGSDVPCAANARAGMGPADAFLKKVIPEIKRSPAYKADGLIAITFDNAPQTGPQADSSSCCGNPIYPNMLGVTTTPTATTTTGATTTTTTAGTTTTTGTTSSTGTTPTTATTTTGTTTTGTSTTGTTTTGTSTSGTTTTGTTMTGTTTTGTTTTGTTTGTTTTGTSGSTGLGGGQTNPTGGGGQVGLVLLSKYVKPNFPEVTDYYNHFSLLASIESLLGLQRLGYGADSQLPVFGSAVYNNYTPG